VPGGTRRRWSATGRCSAAPCPTASPSNTTRRSRHGVGLAGSARRPLQPRAAGSEQHAAQLAYAQVLTYREETRAQGIEILRRLSGQPDSQGAATAAWRQALTWVGAGPEAVRPLEGYLQQFPNDAEIQRRLEEARNPPQAAGDLVGEGRAAAWRAFNANRLRDAEERFAAVLAVEPNDADGLGGLGLIRLRQGNRAEARRYLEAAIAADPSRRSAWERALQGATQQGAPARGQSGGAPGPDIQSARNLVEAGNFSQAEPLLARIIARNGGDRPDAEALLGDIALRQGNPDAAEQRYRAALARRAISARPCRASPPPCRRRASSRKRRRCSAGSASPPRRSCAPMRSVPRRSGPTIRPPRPRCCAPRSRTSRTIPGRGSTLPG
jgi:tetratricopeptide (TPR) repeat protein